MIATFAALLLAHALADFVLQSNGMATGKDRPGPLSAHVAIVFGLSLVALGGAPVVAGAVGLAHLVIDWIKARFTEDGLPSYIADQAAHLITLLAATILWPAAFETGFWPALLPADLAAQAPAVALALAGFILAVRMGQFLVAKLMQAVTPELPEDEPGLPQGGAIIGLLERALTYVLILTGQATAVGFLIAAKSFLRTGTVEKNRAMAEYVIIGTLASIGWAILVALAVRLVLPT